MVAGRVRFRGLVNDAVKWYTVLGECRAAFSFFLWLDAFWLNVAFAVAYLGRVGDSHSFAIRGVEYSGGEDAVWALSPECECLRQ